MSATRGRSERWADAVTQWGIMGVVVFAVENLYCLKWDEQKRTQKWGFKLLIRFVLIGRLPSSTWLLKPQATNQNDPSSWMKVQISPGLRKHFGHSEQELGNEQQGSRFNKDREQTQTGTTRVHKKNKSKLQDEQKCLQEATNRDHPQASLWAGLPSAPGRQAS